MREKEEKREAVEQGSGEQQTVVNTADTGMREHVHTCDHDAVAVFIDTKHADLRGFLVCISQRVRYELFG